jgi:hypothetical protein
VEREGAQGMSRITDSGHFARLERALAIDAPVSAGLMLGGQAIIEEARFNLNDGAISGPGHVPGPPGGYSKSDSHELEKSLAVHEPIETAGTIYVAAGAFDCPHAVMQELGTEHMLPRPNLQLATIARGRETAPAIAAEMRKARNG